MQRQISYKFARQGRALFAGALLMGLVLSPLAAAQASPGLSFEQSSAPAVAKNQPQRPAPANPDKQDQEIPSAPLPAAVWPAVLVFGGIVAYRITASRRLARA